MERNALTLNHDIYEVKSVIEVKLDNFVILFKFSWSESNWNLNLLFTRHEYLAGDNWEIKIDFLFKI
jgi:hypothetical protein